MPDCDLGKSPPFNIWYIPMTLNDILMYLTYGNVSSVFSEQASTPEVNGYSGSWSGFFDMKLQIGRYF